MDMGVDFLLKAEKRRPRNGRLPIRYTIPNVWYISDSSPSCDDSHTVLHLMPKNRPPEGGFFRRVSLPAAFFCVWRIRLSTLETRDLYPTFQLFRGFRLSSLPL